MNALGMVEVYSFRNRAQYYYQAGMIYLRELKDYKKCAIVLKKSLENLLIVSIWRNSYRFYLHILPSYLYEMVGSTSA